MSFPASLLFFLCWKNYGQRVSVFLAASLRPLVEKTSLRQCTFFQCIGYDV